MCTIEVLVGAERHTGPLRIEVCKPMNNLVLTTCLQGPRDFKGIMEGIHMNTDGLP